LSASSPAVPASSSTPPDPSVRRAFPVAGKASYAHTHHDYPATDIMAACGTKVVAAVTGQVLVVVRTDIWDPQVNAGATRGGLAVSLLGDDGVRYYGSHLSQIDAAIQPGKRVVAGQTLGAVGRTGDASACHLHFGLSPACQKTGDWWIQREVIWPWPYLDSWRGGGAKSPVPEITAWHSKNGCPSKPLVDP